MEIFCCEHLNNLLKYYILVGVSGEGLSMGSIQFNALKCRTQVLVSCCVRRRGLMYEL